MNEPRDESEEPLIIVARAVRTRGLKGELVAELLTDFPDRFKEVSELSGVGPNQERKRLTLENHWFQNDRIVLKFSGYDDIETARSLVGYEFGLPESDRVQLQEDEFYNWELEGCLVQTREGVSIGTVREIMRTGGVELLVVEDSERREHLIPMAEPIVVEIDVPLKKILVDPPEGLLDL